MKIVEVYNYRDYHELSKFRTGVGKNENKFHFTTWPPPQQELLQAQQRIFQDPQWLAYYAFAGFDFNHISNDKVFFDRHKNVFHFYDVPGIFRDGDPDRLLVDVDFSGNVSTRGSEEYAVPLPEALAVCINYVKAAVPFTQYLTGQYYVRFGPWSTEEVSKNYATGELERGVSAYDAHFDLETRRWDLEVTNEAAAAGTMQSLIYGTRDIFLIIGREVARGSDDEPVLKNIKILKRLTKKDIFVGGMFDPYEDER